MVIALGEFDGVHRRHAELVDEAMEEARDRVTSLMVVVIDATGHPQRPGQLMNVRRRCQLLILAGASTATVIPAASSRHAGDQLTALLTRLQPSVVLLDPEARDIVDASITERPEVRAPTDRPGPSRDPAVATITTAGVIRALTDGDITTVTGMLGRPPELEGVLRGPATRGVLTLAVGGRDIVPPAIGTYAARVRLDGAWEAAVVSVVAGADDARRLDVRLARAVHPPHEPVIVGLVARLGPDDDPA